jgi:hypothetical protein
MGGAAKVVTAPVTAVSKIVDPISSIASSIPVVGPIAGPVAGYITGGPMGAAKVIAGDAIMGRYSGGGGGGGGGDGGGTATPTGPTFGGGTTASTPFYSPTYNYGANAYTVDNNPFDTSKYFIQGNKGTYNILPQLANLYDPSTQQRAGAPSANIYNDIIGQFAQNQDTLAQQNFQNNFNLRSFAPNSVTTSLPADYNVPDYLRSDIQNALGEYYPSGSTPSGVVPVNYADFGFKQGDTLQNIANYARQQNNPFFMPYAPENVKPEPEPYRAPTVMPVPSMMTPEPTPTRYKPSVDARGPAPRDLTPTSVATSGSFRPAEPGSTTATTAAEPAPGTFKPVNIRTGGLATLRRK